MIHRQFPSYTPRLSYPIRYTLKNLKECQIMATDKNFINDYQRWLKGVNYITGRRVKVDGKMHKFLGEKFLLSDKNEYCEYVVLFTNLLHIMPEIYISETERIYKEITEKNNAIIKRNQEIATLINEIKKLTDWDAYIEYDGVKYGLPATLNGVHYENNCKGKINTVYEPCRCHLCEDWSGCKSGGTTYYICESCNTLLKK